MIMGHKETMDNDRHVRSRRATQRSLGQDEMLRVYECRGPGLPESEPKADGYLGLWTEPPFYYLFFRTAARKYVEDWVGAQAGWELKSTYCLPHSHWKEQFRSARSIGPFCILPAEDGIDESSSDIPIRLTRGLVFGSGVHPTTQGCLRALARFFKYQPQAEVVDLGTGSGILALACLLLGSEVVYGIDCNVLAVQEARANARLNHLDGKIRLLVADRLSVLNRVPPLLLANLEWNCLNVILRDPAWQRHRWALLSGFLVEQDDQVKSLLPPSWTIWSRLEVDGWMTILVQAPDGH